MNAALPLAVAQRWTPMRLGLVDIFHYGTEEFAFHGGRLLLRGNNGTGKSKVLALTLPFLLDGDISPQRVEPDRDANKRMDWNLLLGGRYTDRLGYCWIEFGRTDDAGQAEYRTLLCGMKAVQGKGITKKWFAITHLRMGAGLYLVDTAGLALSVQRLRDLLGTDGRIIDTAAQWRRTVDEELFGLGQSRYDAMLSLLIQLRQPQLSRKPDENAMDQALTQALPPLDQAVIAAVADAMRNLEDERQALNDIATTHRTLTRFARRYQRYARAALRRRESEVRSRQSEWETASVSLRDSRVALEHAQLEQDQVSRRQRETEGRRRDLRVVIETIQASPAMQDAARLDEAREAADRAGQAVATAQGNVDAARSRLAQRTRALQEASAALADASDRSTSAIQRSGDLSDPLGLRGAVAQHAQPVADVVAATAATLSTNVFSAEAHTSRARVDVAAASAALELEVQRRRGAVAEVRRLAQQVEEARRVVARLEADRDRANRTRGAAAEQAQLAAAVLTERGEAHLAASQDWVAGLEQLKIVDAVGQLDALSAWVAEPAGPDPLAEPVQAAGRVAVVALTQQESALEQTILRLTDQRGAAQDERAELVAGVDPSPAPSPTRDIAGRAGRAGAPLWQLLEFRSDVSPADQAGIEAALEGAGLLDAWVNADGSLADPAWRDAGVTSAADTAGSVPGSIPGAALSDVVAAAEGQPVPAELVRRLLGGIGLGSSSRATWIAPDGRYRIGSIQGAWTKPAAAHIGAAARQAARAARIAELDELIVALDDQLGDVARQMQALQVRQAQLDREIAARPDPTAVRKAGDSLEAATSALRRAEEELREAQERLDKAVATTRAAETACNSTAVQLGLSPAIEQLEQVAAGIAELAVHLGAVLWPACREAVAAAGRCAAETAQVAGAEAELAGQRAHLDQVTQERRDLRTIAQKMADLVGTTVQQAQEELARNKVALRAVGKEIDALAEQSAAAGKEIGRLEGRIEGFVQTTDERRGARDGAVAALRRAVEHGVLAAALPDAEPPASWAADPAVRFARQISNDLADVDVSEEAWNGVQATIARGVTELQSELSVQGGSAEQTLADELLVVTVRYWGRTAPAHQLLDVLTAEIAEREVLLSAQERELIEIHLIDEAGAQLGLRIREAEAQTDTMNQQLQNCATSTGMRLRLRWMPGNDAPASLRAAMDVLRQTHQLWGPKQREVLGQLLQDEIARAREADEQATWAEHLAQALDYRRWFSFKVERGGPDGWRKATGPASGGERALAVTLPLFAAAASHYSSARKDAPRLVLLDEAFAGVDNQARRACMGLLTAFDLDCVLTSEREWGTYPEVPGLSICHLIRREGIDAVLVSRWQWDGSARVEVGEPVDSVRQVAAATVPGVEQDQPLFALE